MVVGSGIDVLEIERLARALERRGARFAARVFHPAELAACRGRRRPAPFLAERFAAKEAVMKAFGTGWAHGVRWVDIEVRDVAGAARIALHGAVAELARRRGIVRIHLGLGHSRSLAVATVLLESGQA